MGFLKTYYHLTKPGIIYGNLLTTIAGFFLASKGDIHPGLLVATALGTSFGIGSACVFNNYIDRGIDEKMARTKNRALVTGDVSPLSALIYGTVLGIIGFLILFFFTNLLTVFVGFVGCFFYLAMYGYFKRRSVYGTIIGSVSGAMPIVAGYTAVTGIFDAGAILLFLILVFWQMPHFYAIGIYRLSDYDSAGLPILPVVAGIEKTKIHILLYMIGFVIATVLLSLFGYTGVIYLVVMVVVGSYWLYLSGKGFTAKNNMQWGRSLFKFSLIVLLVFSLMISIDGFLPK